MLATLWANVEAAIPLIAIIGAGIIVYATRGIPKARIEGLEGSVKTLQDNNAALHEQLTSQQQKHEDARQQDKADCDKRIDQLELQIAHALREASAARSDVMTAVSEAATAAVRAENQEAMSKASAALAVGQQQLLDVLRDNNEKLDRIETALGGKK